MRIVPFEVSYDTVNTLNRYADRLLYTSTILSLCISAMGRYDLFLDAKSWLIVTNILFICIYIFLDQRAQLIFIQAEMKRRIDWLDNSFGTNFSGKRSQEYFTNDNLETGIKKLAANCFENSHHTHFIISKMSPRILTQTIIIVLLFVFSAIVGDQELARLFFELSLPALLIGKLVKIIYYKDKITTIYDRFKALFNDLLTIEFNKTKTAEALRNIVEYETAISWASTPLDSDTFYKHKDQLAYDWNELKKEYKIE